MKQTDLNARQNADPAALEPAVEPQLAADGRTALPSVEFYGPKGLEPTRYGDWERKGRCVDF